MWRQAPISDNSLLKCTVGILTQPTIHIFPLYSSCSCLVLFLPLLKGTEKAQSADLWPTFYSCNATQYLWRQNLVDSVGGDYWSIKKNEMLISIKLLSELDPCNVCTTMQTQHFKQFTGTDKMRASERTKKRRHYICKRCPINTFAMQMFRHLTFDVSSIVGCLLTA